MKANLWMTKIWENHWLCWRKISLFSQVLSFCRNGLSIIWILAKTNSKFGSWNGIIPMHPYALKKKTTKKKLVTNRFCRFVQLGKVDIICNVPFSWRWTSESKNVIKMTIREMSLWDLMTCIPVFWRNGLMWLLSCSPSYLWLTVTVRRNLWWLKNGKHHLHFQEREKGRHRNYRPLSLISHWIFQTMG